MVAWQRRVAGADQFRSAPIHRSESPTGYSSAGCSPAEPASASPVADNNTSNPGPARQSNCAAQPHCRDAVQVALVVSAANASVISTLRAGCHFYLAPTPLRRVTPLMESRLHSNPLLPLRRSVVMRVYGAKKE